MENPRFKPISDTMMPVMDYPIFLYSDLRFGRVEEEILAGKKGWIKFAGSYWSAKLWDETYPETIAPGSTVQVKGHQGNALLVMPIRVGTARS